METLENYEVKMQGISYFIDGTIFENSDGTMGEIEFKKVEVEDLNGDEGFIEITDPMTLQVLKEIIKIDFEDQFRDLEQESNNRFLHKLWNER
jgi:hypothetical protein